MITAALLIGSYQFAPPTKFSYEMQTVFEGFIPILGGQEGKAEVKLGVDVTGLAKGADDLKAQSELTKAEISFNEAKLPLGLENIQNYFPKTTVEFSLRGKVSKTDAPDVSLPVKLPGLDVKRFPEISYLPLQFGDVALEVGASWKFVRQFAGSDVNTECTVTEVKEQLVTIELKLRQTYTVLENSALEAISDEKEAVNSVDTVLDGSGTATFDSKLGVFRLVSIKAVAVSKVTNLESGEKSERKLKTTLNVKLKS